MAHFECRVRYADESYRLFSCTCSAPQGELPLLAALCRDVTEQYHLRQTREKWKNRYDAAASVARDIIFEWNTETGELVWGGSFEQVLGYTAGEMPPDIPSWLRLVHPDQRAQQERLVERIPAERCRAESEHSILRKNGTYVPVRSEAQFFQNAAGRLVRRIGFLTDRSAHKAAEDRFRLTIDAVRTGILLADRAGRIVFANEEMERQFGNPRQEQTGKPVEFLIPERS